MLGSREMDEAKRYAIYHEFQQVASDNLPVIYTALAERITAVRNHYGNMTPTLYACTTRAIFTYVSQQSSGWA